MKAMILAAGKGTRLQLLTRDTPKALIKAGGLSLLERLIRKMKVQGVSEIVINVHHHAEKIRAFLKEKDNFKIGIEISDESEELLETGGGILKAAKLLGAEKPFIVHNVDILSDIDLRTLYNSHVKENSLVTLAVKDRKTSRYLLFDEHLRMQGWENQSSGERIVCSDQDLSLIPLAFSGIHVIDPGIFPLISESGKFSIIETYLRLCNEHLIRGYRHDKGLWIDTGKPEGLNLANMLMGSHLEYSILDRVHSVM